MKRRLAVLLALLSPTAFGATAYVSDELILGVFSGLNGQGERLATLHSGAMLETLAVNGDFTRVRLADGTVGWVKTAYLVTQEPATARAKRLEDELARLRATTPALAEAAQRSETKRLRSQLEALQQNGGRPVGGATSHWRIMGSITLIALGVGYWLGYFTLARRIKHKYGGLKVY